MTTANASTSTPAILVTGATGKIGSQVARKLIAQCQRVALASRNPDKLAELVASSDGLAEARRLDLEDPSTFTAFEGVETVFLVGPGNHDFGERTAVIVEALAKAGVTHVVRYSALGANADAPFLLARQHAMAEQAIERSDLGWTILQPTFYQDNLVTFQAGAIKDTDAFYGASGEGRSAYINSEDIAAAATEVLTHPSAHASQRYVLTGPEALSDAEVAERITAALGRTIRYVDVGDEGVTKSVLDNGGPQWMAESMAGLEQVKRNGWAGEVSPVVEQILGRPAQGIDAFLERNAGALR